MYHLHLLLFLALYGTSLILTLFQALSKRLGQDAIPEDEEVKATTTLYRFVCLFIQLFVYFF